MGIVVAELKRGIVCFDVDGNRQWEFPMMPQVSAAPAVGDVDGDGHEDVAATDQAGNLVVLDGHGKLLWRARLSAGVMAESCPVIADLDGDGALEILAGDVSGTLTCLDHTGRVRWIFEAESRIGPVLVADLYDLPGAEIVVPTADGRLYVLGDDGRWLWDLHVPDEVFPNSTPVLADVDGDGLPELYIGGGLHHFLRIDLSRRKIVHSENVYLHINAAITAADLDGDGKDEIVFGNKGGAIYVYGEQGVRWKYEPRHGATYAAPNIVNIDDDPELEIVSHGLIGGLVVLEHDGTVAHTETKAPVSVATPLLGDLDGDGQMEVVVTSGAAGLVSASVQRGTISWIELGAAFHESRSNRLTYAGNRARRGVVASPERYRTVALPTVRNASSADGPTVVGEFSLHGGLNKWRFDIQNPASTRLTLLTEVRTPDGLVRRSVRHADGPRSRAVVPLSVARSGEYRITQQLLATDRLEQFAARSAVLDYTGPTAERKALSEQTAASMAEALTRWKHVNRQAAEGMEVELNRIRAELDRPLATGGEKDHNLARRIDEVARLRAELARLRLLATAGESLAGPSHFIAWQGNPWAHFDERSSLPAAGDRTEGLAVSLCVGEFESL
ncbi:MAG: FG-GAP-like repeat-containing protein, partial [Pirellulales bacterium]